MGMANVYTPPSVGATDDRGFVLRERHAYAGNGPVTEVWSRHDAARNCRITEHRVEGQVIGREEAPEGALTNWGSWSSGYGNYININHTPLNIGPSRNPAPEPSKDNDTEDDMAQRQDFTFPYTGQEIADALSRKIQRITDKITALHSLDSDALTLLYDIERDTDLSKRVEREVKELQKRVEALVKERTPYAKAGSKQSFDIDLEDIEHFGLNDEGAPEPVKKVRRARKPKESAPLVESGGGAVG